MQLNSVIANFKVIAIHPVGELSCNMYELRHEKSGARLVWLDRPDENKTFGIAFRTVPEDDTGVFHILEHSVLCGSKKYPVKEPFVELMKSSMKTFLNAMTFQDKTFYPISSRSHKDFINLMRVYMDAVLHPLIYEKPEIFMQEGWHYELDEKGDPSYKGVVFNEMKGNFDSPDIIMQNALLRTLYPDTCYRFVSGGDPAHIPDLSYEQFLDAHRRFYHPGNSYIFLDGEMDIQQVLTILDEEYLCEYDAIDPNTEIAMQQPVTGARTTVSYEVSPEESLEKKARAAWGFGLGDYTCREEVMAMYIIANVLCGSNQAPLKKAILEQGLAQDILLGAADGTLQPYVSIMAYNLDAQDADKIEELIRNCMRQVMEEGLDKEHIRASLANMELQMRERDFGSMPQGLGFSMTVLGSWLYGGDPASCLEYGPVFDSLNAKLDSGYFEELIGRVFLENPYNCRVLLVPDRCASRQRQENEVARLAAARESWTETDLARLNAQQEKLLAWQNSEDTLEALATIPKLLLSDIPETTADIPTEVVNSQGVELLRHNISTGGLNYWNLYFDFGDIPEEEIAAVSLLCSLLGNLDTQSHSALDFQKLGSLYMGDMRFTMETYGKENDAENCRAFICAAFSCLDTKAEKAMALALEALTQTIYDKQRVQELVKQMRSWVEESIMGNGHGAALARVSAAFSAEGVIQETCSGYSYLQWLKKLEKDYDTRAEEICASMEAMAKRIFHKGKLTVSVTGAESATEAVVMALIHSTLPDGDRNGPKCVVKPRGRCNEGLCAQADVAYAVMGADLNAVGSRYDAPIKIAGRIISLNYLWNVIRVQGGAYGTGLVLQDSGKACFYSYRDPNAAASLEAYRKAPDFLEDFLAGEPDLTSFITGAISEMEPVMMPKALGKAGDRWYFKDMPYEYRCEARKRLLRVTAQELKAYIEPLRRLAQEASICVFGGEKQLAECNLDTILSL